MRIQNHVATTLLVLSLLPLGGLASLGHCIDTGQQDSHESAHHHGGMDHDHAPEKEPPCPCSHNGSSTSDCPTHGRSTSVGCISCGFSSVLDERSANLPIQERLIDVLALGCQSELQFDQEVRNHTSLCLLPLRAAASHSGTDRQAVLSSFLI